MGGMDWVLEIALMGLLALTLVHAIRLERALGALRRDRSALGDAVAGFDSSTREVEAGLDRLHRSTQEAAQQVARKIEGAAMLKEDLSFLAERGELLADRLEQLIRTGRTLDPARAGQGPDARPRASGPDAPSSAPGPDALRSKAERDLLHALRVAR